MDCFRLRSLSYGGQVASLAMTADRTEGTMAFRQRRERLRSILNGAACIRPGSVYDATSIRIAEDLGFELGMFGGSVASLAVLGDPDITPITDMATRSTSAAPCRSWRRPGPPA